MVNQQPESEENRGAGRGAARAHGSAGDVPPAKETTTRSTKSFAAKILEGQTKVVKSKSAEKLKTDSDEKYWERLMARKKVHSDVNVMPIDHLTYLLDNFRNTDDLIENLAFQESLLLNRLDCRLPLMDDAFVQNIAHALSFIFNSDEKSNWEKPVGEKIEKMIEDQIVRLYGKDELTIQ